MHIPSPASSMHSGLWEARSCVPSPSIHSDLLGDPVHENAQLSIAVPGLHSSPVFIEVYLVRIYMTFSYQWTPCHFRSTLTHEIRAWATPQLSLLHTSSLHCIYSQRSRHPSHVGIILVIPSRYQQQVTPQLNFKYHQAEPTRTKLGKYQTPIKMPNQHRSNRKT